MSDTDKPHRPNFSRDVSQYADPKASVKDTRDLRDPYEVYLLWKKQRV